MAMMSSTKLGQRRSLLWLVRRKYSVFGHCLSGHTYFVMAPVSIKGPSEVVAASLASHTTSCLHGDSLPSIVHTRFPPSSELDSSL